MTAVTAESDRHDLGGPPPEGHRDFVLGMTAIGRGTGA